MIWKFSSAENILKARMRNGAFLSNLKRCFGSWNCWKKMKSRWLNNAFLF